MVESPYNRCYFRRYSHYLNQDLNKIPLFAKIGEWVKEEKPARILDIGCGLGYLLSWLCQKVNSCGWGIDFSEEAIDQAKMLFSKTNFFQRKAENLPFKDNFFDCLLMINLIEHLDGKEQKKVLVGAKRVLKDRGLLILSTPEKNSLYKKLMIHDPTHRKELTKRELLGLVKKDFKLEEIVYTNSIGRFGRSLNFLLSTLFPADLVLKLRKKNP